MLYGYGLSLGWKLLALGRVAPALRLLWYPVDYWRHAEYAAVLEALGPRPAGRVLDVGSPKLLSLYLAERRGLAVEATDLSDYFIEPYRRLAALAGLEEARYRPATADGRALPYAAQSFDFAYAISVVEHIPGEGDSNCLRELGRVLRRGGRCVVTVPFAPLAREERRQPDFYWAAAAGAAIDNAAGEAVFYQRRYDEAALHARLIEPSGLRLASLNYIGERVLTRAATRQMIDYLGPRAGPLHGPLAALCLTRPRGDWKSLKKPLCAVIVLEKPAGPERRTD